MSYVELSKNGKSVTSIAEWRTNRKQLFDLPSNNRILLKRVGLMDLIAVARIPKTLSAMAAQVASKTRIGELGPDDLRQYAEVVNVVVQACAVEPKVGPEASDDTLALHEIDFVDKVAIFNWANGAANALRPFRPDQQAGAAESA